MSRLIFTEIKDTGKTKVWEVSNADHGATLGVVKWSGQWRQYVYRYDTMAYGDWVQWSADCLEELTEFIKARMAER